MQDIELERIDRGEDWVIYRHDTARTAYPFMEEARTDGGYNHPSYDLTVRQDMIGQIPEVVRFPFLGPILEAANSRWSLLRTTACDAGALPRDPRPSDEYTHCVGGMVVIAYRLDWHNTDPHKLTRLARMIVDAMDRLDPICRVRYIIEPYKSWHGKEEPTHYNVTLEFAGLGYSREEALAAAETTAR
jgi:hypothetical protein